MRVLFASGPALSRCTAILIAAFFASPLSSATASDDPATLADTTPTRVLAVVSGGFWEETVEAADAANEDGAAEGSETQETEAAKQQSIRGYYRSVAIRSQDNTSRLYLQRIQLSEDGPKLLDSTEIEALTELQAYITDMRPEDSTGIARQPGFVTYIYLKRDPASQEPDTWELFIDQFGDTAFVPATN